ncbi:hypothetical protein V6Z12_D11G321700 [Gossypium hirsutum]
MLLMTGRKREREVGKRKSIKVLSKRREVEETPKVT